MEKAFQRFEADCKAAEEFLLDWLVKLSPYQRALRGEIESGAGTKT